MIEMGQELCISLKMNSNSTRTRQQKNIILIFTDLTSTHNSLESHNYELNNAILRNRMEKLIIQEKPLTI